MAKRFSRYQFGLKITDGNPPANSPLAKFKDFSSKVTKLTRIGVPIDSMVGYQLDPFETTDTTVKVAASKRAIDGIASTGIALSDLNIVAATNDAKEIDFKPARVTIYATSGATTDKLSQITGEPYKRRTGESYTYPFGKTGTKTRVEVFKAIKIKVKGKDSNFSCSMTPEIYSFK